MVSEVRYHLCLTTLHLVESVLGLQGSRETAFPMNLRVTKIDPSGHVGDGDFGPVVFKGPCSVTYDVKFPPQITMQDSIPVRQPVVYKILYAAVTYCCEDCWSSLHTFIVIPF